MLYKNVRNLIYYKDFKIGNRLYISFILIAEIFKLIYDKLGYLEYDRIYKRFTERFYIFNIIKQLRIYIKYYFNY